MNTKNNKRRRESVAAIEKAFITLLQDRDFRDVTVSDICKITGLNRSTFYANYMDMYDLADQLRAKLEADFATVFGSNGSPVYDGTDGSLRMFTHIYENQLFYKTYFKLGYDEAHEVMIYDTERARQDFHNEHVEYHIEFFRAGLNAIIKRWMVGGCQETPEEMAVILKAEYQGRNNR